ncbi:MAG: CDGSH iron-sulfur domain-containing protein [Thermoplasmata archaeon]
MSRLVRHDAQGPAIVMVGEKAVAVCQCGLSRNKPFCDGSHKATQGETDGPIYVYNEANQRVEVPDQFPPPSKKFVVE